MINDLFKLLILFAVIFDPLVSFMVFFVATKNLPKKEKNKIAMLAILVAAGVSALVILFGDNLLDIFNTNINDFKIAGGIILGIFGVKMALGHSVMDISQYKNNHHSAIAAIIGTPLLTGPAAITTIMITINDYGVMLTSVTIAIILGFTALLFFNADRVNKVMNGTVIQVVSTILGLVMLSWGIQFIRSGFGI